MFIVISVGRQNAVSVIPVNLVDVDLLRDSLPDLVQRLRHLVKGRVQQFDYSILGSKINHDDSLPKAAREVVDAISNCVHYADFLGYDHIRFVFVERLWEHLNTLQQDLTRRYNASADATNGAPLLGVYNAAIKENDRLDELKARALIGQIDNPLLCW